MSGSCEAQAWALAAEESAYEREGVAMLLGAGAKDGHQDGLSRGAGWRAVAAPDLAVDDSRPDSLLGHVYQGRYKSFPVERDEHFLTVCRYVERNALRVKLVRRAENWRWSSLWRREQRDPKMVEWLTEWPVDRPRNWLARVNAAETPVEPEQLKTSVARGRPFGDPAWVRRTAVQLGLETSIRPRGRPRKRKNGEKDADAHEIKPVPFVSPPDGTICRRSAPPHFGSRILIGILPLGPMTARSSPPSSILRRPTQITST